MSEVAEKPIISQELREKFLADVLEEKQVIVHCLLPASPLAGNLARVWPSTFLVDKAGRHRSHLIHAENISFFPQWTLLPPHQDYWFTLVFSGLQKSCKVFDLMEIIPQEGGFHVKNIKRNEKDVYRVSISG